MNRFEHLELEEEFRQYRAEPRATKLFDTDALLEPLRHLKYRTEGLACSHGEESVAQVATRMGEQRVGCTIVVRDGKVVGICTERDIIHKVFCSGSDPHSVRIEEVMTPEPECLQPDDTVAFALHLMDSGGYRHIPLVNDEFEPVGIVSIKDIIEHIVDHFPEEVYNLPPQPLRRGWGGSREGA